MTTPIERPTDEEAEVLLSGLRAARSRLAQIKVQLFLREQPCPEGVVRNQNLLEFLSRGQTKAVVGRRLDQEFEAAVAHVVALEAMYQDWSDRSDAFVESQLKAAPDPDDE